MEGGALRRVAKALRRHAGPQARRTRPLHLLFQKPHRKRPVHFPSVAVGFQSIIIFLTLCTRHRKPLLAKQRSSPANHRAVASSELLACRSLCHYAQLHPFVLRAEYCSRPTAQELNRVLEKSRYASMAASCPDPDLATRVLGSAVAPVRILWREVALRGEQSGAPRQGELNVLEWHDP